MDEPTNHLDILAKEKLESILSDYPGTIIFVTHDRYFVNKLAQCLLVFKNGEAKYYNLTYDEYLEKVKFEKIPKPVENPKNKIKQNKVNPREQEKNIKKLEREIKIIEENIKSLKDDLFKPEVYSDYTKVNDINLKIENLEKDLLISLEKLEEIE